MTAARWDLVVDIFSKAADLTSDQQGRFLDKVCASDPNLRLEVEDLLLNAGLANTEEFLEDPPWVVDEIPALLPAFDDYQSVEYIGHGGMGVVYRAYDQCLDTQVALKMSLPRRMTTPEDIDRFRIDPRTMARLKHAHIVQVHKVGEYDGKPYFTMNLIEREDGLASLQSHLPQFREDPDRAAKLMIKVARAVHHAHQRGILHRDLKPANILLDDQEDPHVTDFGLAKRMGSEVKQTELSEQPNSASIAYQGIVGTAMYMSPEQADPSPEREVTTASDVYGLGATLYTLLTGEPPFSGGTLETTLQLVRDPDLVPKAPHLLNPRVDETLEAICLKCLSKHPDDRYRSAEGMAKDLERWLRREPTEVQQTWFRRSWNWCRRNPSVAVLVLAAGLLLIVATLTVQGLERRLVEQVHRSNMAAAESMAATILYRLREELSETVLSVASNVEVQRILKTIETADEGKVKAFLASSDGARLQELAQALLKQRNEKLKQRHIPEFKSLFILNKSGILVAIAGIQDRESTDLGSSFAKRDYFEGAKRHQGRRGKESLHISRMFHSAYDQLYKFAIAAPIVNEDGLLGAVETSITTDSTKALFHIGEAEQMLLVGRGDLTRPWPEAEALSPEYKYVVLFHPDYMPNDEPVPLRNKLWSNEPLEGPELPELNPLSPEQRTTVAALKSDGTGYETAIAEVAGEAGVDIEIIRGWMEDDLTFRMALNRETPKHPIPEYRDPKSDSPYIPGWARVGNSELVVIAQRPYEEAIGDPLSLAKNLVFWGWIAIGLTGLLTAAIIWQRNPPIS